ncbi:MAG: arsenate reductase [Chitinophagaceae bacterium]|nr:MAG: arsenate reductase [Chitinophagaceae bacterium]
MDTVYYLPGCDTCRKILASLPPHSLEMRDIKKQPLTALEVDALKALSGSYEALFSRQSQQYKALGLKDKQLSESDYRQHLLEHYTFLKRPVFVIGKQIYIGNKPDNVARVVAALS